MELVGNTQLVAGGEEDVPLVLASLAQEGVAAQGDADLYVRAYARFGVEEARELRERALLRPVSRMRRMFVIAAPTLTSEAQNALLKTLEESNALFVFVTPSPYLLLPALRSRAQMLGISSLRNVQDAERFLHAPPAERLELLKPLLEKDDEDKRDLRPILAFLSSLEHALGARVQDAGAREGLESVYRARMYLADKGALVKPLLEQVALIAPVIR